MIAFHYKKLKPNQSFDIKIDDECIIQVDHAKFLGVTFDANLRRTIISRNVVFDFLIYRCLVGNEQIVNKSILLMPHYPVIHPFLTKSPEISFLTCIQISQPT